MANRGTTSMPPSTTLPRNRSAHSMTHAGRWMGLTASNTQSCTHVRLTNYHAHSYPLLPFNSLRLKLLYLGAAWPPTSALLERHHFRTAFTLCFGLSFGPTTDLSPPLSDIAPCFSDTNFDSQQRWHGPYHVYLLTFCSRTITLGLLLASLYH